MDLELELGWVGVGVGDRVEDATEAEAEAESGLVNPEPKLNLAFLPCPGGFCAVVVEAAEPSAPPAPAPPCEVAGVGFGFL